MHLNQHAIKCDIIHAIETHIGRTMSPFFMIKMDSKHFKMQVGATQSSKLNETESVPPINYLQFLFTLKFNKRIVESFNQHICTSNEHVFISSSFFFLHHKNQFSMENKSKHNKWKMFQFWLVDAFQYYSI